MHSKTRSGVGEAKRERCFEFGQGGNQSEQSSKVFAVFTANSKPGVLRPIRKTTSEQITNEFTPRAGKIASISTCQFDPILEFLNLCFCHAYPTTRFKLLKLILDAANMPTSFWLNRRDRPQVAISAAYNRCLENIGVDGERGD